MSSVELVAIPSGVSLLTVIVSRIRCLCKPDRDGCHFQSGCLEGQLQKDEHEVDITRHDINGREVLVITSKD